MSLNINTLNSSRYSFIQGKGSSGNLAHTKSSQSNGLWREDLHQSMQDARRDVRQQAMPVLLEVQKSQHRNDLFAIYTGQNPNNGVSNRTALNIEQKLERHARNQVLLQAYDEHVGSDVAEPTLNISA
ncbi:hypothetical protein HQ393_12630 [Chitinibacter bivalviorum]|uniref:Uncharacterized protein n=1 Tax=Chitinibacter bivalviorum TaxID=2739434 RepID=A0A7H9BL00_9NEIS|nr:hypothetical protein [Chitinibacter bivalviorum]QLG89016.1 hypothetical protein HQ393_12630 [Chitinibacter bivalviorum]